MAEKTKKRDLWYSLGFLIFALLLLVVELVPITYSDDATVNTLADTTVSRIAGALAFFFLVLRSGYRIFGRTSKKYLKNALLCFPALVIVVNNLPIIGLISGNAYVTSPNLIWLFTLQCIAIGAFEELAFRGFVFPYIMEKRCDTRVGVLIAIILSGAVFALMHMLNLLGGASFGGVVLQIGYSFLIGAMCSVVLIKTHNIWICILLHAIYDFCGFLVPTLGEGLIWDVATVMITAVLSVVVMIYMVCLFFKADLSDVKDIYGE